MKLPSVRSVKYQTSGHAPILSFTPAAAFVLFRPSTPPTRTDTTIHFPMANHPPHAHNPNTGNADETTPRPPTSDEQLKAFWLKNEKSIYIALIVVIAVVVIFKLWDSMRSSADDTVATAFKAATTPEKLRAFVNENPGASLAAVAAIRLADDAFQKKNYAEAAADYDKAAVDKTALFAPRALLGAAMSKILGGQNADGENRLTRIANDAALPAIVRAEAAYHLATLAENAGRAADAAKLYDQVATLAPKSPWAEEAAYQRDRMSVTGAAALPITVSPSAAASGTTSSLPSLSFPAQ